MVAVLAVLLGVALVAGVKGCGKKLPDMIPMVPAAVHAQHVQLDASYLPARLVALHWAERQAGCWYSWGGSNCAEGFDCSGLVMAAYAHAGIWLPHNTVAMLYSGHLRWEPRSQARWGDLTMWGGSFPFHVELFFGYDGLRTFGAHEAGTRVGVAWNGGWWYDAESFYRVV